MRINDLLEQKNTGKKWTMLTAYDAPTAEILEKGGVDWILVGDSLGMVVLGYSSTAPVTMEEMLHHTRAARRGAPNSFIIGDMPLKAVQDGVQKALKAAKEFIRDGANAVKVEWREDALEITHKLLRNGIPVMGHVGLTPQTAGPKGFKVRGADAEGASEVLEHALSFEKEGAFAVLLECVPAPVSKVITKKLKVPVIGIGAGADCDGQVLVFHDMVGWFTKFRPRFVKRYADAQKIFGRAIGRYIQEVQSGKFPDKARCFSMKSKEYERFVCR